eukprot:TRINITY_DN18058_c0_g1_i1.p1 TRINITY_DN18058_c0_g1~~TRINITY_DN18058_c0_g1_i1.p1  ORF type:complete len:179 (+),score=14.70 TRINITY_DN18058_c0_g1_i1:160-696(+)
MMLLQRAHDDQRLEELSCSIQQDEEREVNSFDPQEGGPPQDIYEVSLGWQNYTPKFNQVGLLDNMQGNTATGQEGQSGRQVLFTSPKRPRHFFHRVEEGSKKDISKAPSNKLEVKACKICIQEEETRETGKLINPCRCDGSMKWVHEECLKTWITTRFQTVSAARCELCDYLLSLIHI